MDHSEQTLILKFSKSLGDGGCGQVREHPGEIIVGHPNPIAADMIMALQPPLFPVEAVKLDGDGCRIPTLERTRPTILLCFLRGVANHGRESKP